MQSTKRFEFSYLFNGQPHFAIVYDDNIVKACERILFRAIDPTEIVTTSNGTYLVRGWFDNEMMAVKEDPWMPSTSLPIPKVHPTERTKKGQPSIDTILEGLI